jgi:hypothetical protein
MIIIIKEIEIVLIRKRAIKTRTWLQGMMIISRQRFLGKASLSNLR